MYCNLYNGAVSIDRPQVNLCDSNPYWVRTFLDHDSHLISFLSGAFSIYQPSTLHGIRTGTGAAFPIRSIDRLWRSSGYFEPFISFIHPEWSNRGSPSVYPDGSSVFERVDHVLPLAQGQRRARSKGHFKVAANCSLRPGKPDGRQFELGHGPNVRNMLGDLRMEFVKPDGSLLSCHSLATTIIC
jgi:hypothetical protein